MAFVVKDRVKETTTTQGTGTLTLNGAATGFQGFSAIGDGNTTYYTISGGSQWEVGIGIYTASGTTLSRDTVLASSNNGNLVNLSAGSKDVFVVYPSGRAVIVNGTTIEVPNLATLPISAGGTGSNTASFSGANITNINANNISSGILAVAQGGTGSATASFSGANITSLNASNVSSGVLPLDHGGTGSATASFSGANITSLNASNFASGILPVLYGGTGSNSATFSGVNITSINASNISSGTLAVAQGGTGSTTLTANNVILGNSTSAVQFVAPGANGNVLTSNGTTWTSAAVGGGFDAGTRLIFAQTAAPTGWTKDTTNYNNHALRVVTGAAGTGGTVDFTTAFTSQAVTGTVSVTASTGQIAQGGTVTIGQTTAGGSVSSSVPAASTGAVTQGGSISVSGSVGNTTLSTPTIPSHNHSVPTFNDVIPGNPTVFVSGGNPNRTPQFTYNTNSTGGDGAHSHPFSVPSASFTGQPHSHPVSVTVSSSFTGTAHNHTSPFTGDLHNHPVSAPASFSGSAINLAVKYLDVITATKN